MTKLKTGNSKEYKFEIIQNNTIFTIKSEINYL